MSTSTLFSIANAQLNEYQARFAKGKVSRRHDGMTQKYLRTARVIRKLDMVEWAFQDYRLQCIADNVPVTPRRIGSTK